MNPKRLRSIFIVLFLVLLSLAISDFSFAVQRSGMMQSSLGSSIVIEKRWAKSQADSQARTQAAEKDRLKNERFQRVVLERKERLHRVLISLDQIASATLQLKPETAQRLEPVVVDLAEQAIELSRENRLNENSNDASLIKLEETVRQLTRTMNRFIEPEMRL